LQILILDNVQCNMGDSAILLAMHASFRDEFGSDTVVKSCFCGSTSDPGVYAQHYPEMNLIRPLWHALYDWYTPKWKVWSKIVRRTAPKRFEMQAKLHQRRVPFSTLFGQERELFREFVKSDLIVVSGGAVLSTSWTAQSLRPHRIAEYHAALELGKPLVFYAASYGPFEDQDDLPDLLKAVMERSAAVICRDANALKIVEERIGVKTANVHKTIDEAILLQPRTLSRNYVPEKSLPVRVGLVAHKWHWSGHEDRKAKQAEFESRIAHVCREILSEYDTDMVFITSHPEVPKAMFVEVDVPRRIKELLPDELKPRVHVVTEFIHPQEFAGLMGQCDLVLSSRMHGGVLSLAGGAPLLALSYEPKTRGFLEQIGLEDWMLSMGESSAEEILKKARWMLDNRVECRKRRDIAVEKARSIALQNRKIVRDAFEKHQKRS
jgi:colanic acid/amylovoran biosynthesis protein